MNLDSPGYHLPRVPMQCLENGRKKATYLVFVTFRRLYSLYWNQ